MELMMFATRLRYEKLDAGQSPFRASAGYARDSMAGKVIAVVENGSLDGTAGSWPGFDVDDCSQSYHSHTFGLEYYCLYI